MENITITRENLKLYTKHEIENNDNPDICVDYPDIDLIPIVKLLYQILLNESREKV